MVGNKIKKKSLTKIWVFILAIFLIPRGKDYNTYFVLIFILGMFMFFTSVLNKSKITRIALFLTVTVAISSLFRLFSLDISLDKDFTEVARLFFPTYLLVMSYSFRYLTFNSLLQILSLVVVVDFGISVMEFLVSFTDTTAIYNFVKSNYWSETHWISRGRSKGLFSGPGQHASSAVFLFTLFLSNYYFGGKTKAFKMKMIILVLMLVFIILATLSRTGLLCMFISFLLLTLLKLKKLTRKNLISVSVPFLVFSVGINYFIVSNSKKFVRIAGFYEKKEVKMRAREEIWDVLYNKAIQNESYLLIGWGKSYFKEAARQTDNEYLFVVLFYGMIFFIVFLGVTISYLVKFIVKKSFKTSSQISLFVLIIVGYIYAIPSSFFFYLPNLLLFAIVSIIIFNEKNEELKY